VSHVGEKIDIYKILEGNPEGKRLLGRSRLRGEDNIKREHQNNCTDDLYKRREMY
jgi:hypothetical protein